MDCLSVEKSKLFGGEKMIKGIFLATGSIPTKERSCQGILLEFADTSVLVDCGEGIQYQLLKSNADLSKINSIFLTHEHIDHIYGVGGVLALLLNKYIEKVITVYGPKEVILILRSIVNLFMLKSSSRIEYVELNEDQIIKRDSYVCSTFKTYHTESSLGYCFQFNDKKLVLLGDMALPDAEAREKIISEVLDADFAVIDGVHIAAEQAAAIARDANIKNPYLMPILLSKTEEVVLNEISSIFSGVCIPRDLEEFEVK